MGWAVGRRFECSVKKGASPVPSPLFLAVGMVQLGTLPSAEVDNWAIRLALAKSLLSSCSNKNAYKP